MFFDIICRRWGMRMKIINLRMHQVRNLKELQIENGVLNTEGLMLVLKRR